MKFKNVEDIYPLAPTQQGILSHNFYDPGSAMHVEIIAGAIRGEINIPALKKAWQSVIDPNPTHFLRLANTRRAIADRAQAGQAATHVGSLAPSHTGTSAHTDRRVLRPRTRARMDVHRTPASEKF